MKTWRKVGLAVFLGVLSSLSLKLWQFEHVIPPLEEFVKRHGYPLETHEVVTEDGYILTLHRIPHGRGQERGSRHPVLLQHGVAASAYNFVGLGPQSSLSFLLADRGYDVWMGNSRGNKYSSKHITYNTSDSKFWDFSWYEMGLYDAPAITDYILNNTKEKKLSYVAHSMGGTILGVLLSSRPEYNSKFDVFIGFVPALDFEHVNCGLMIFFGYYYAPFIMNFVGHSKWLPSVDVLAEFLHKLCNPDGFFSFICRGFYYSLGVSTQLKKENLQEIFSCLLSTGSLKTFAHFGQVTYHGKFIKYSYKPEENKIRYGSDEPPEFDLKKMTVPSVLFHSTGDNAVVSEGIEKVSKILPNATAYKVPLDTFNHLDFLFGKDAVDLVYKEVFRILDERRKIKKY